MFAVQGFREISDLVQRIRDSNVIACHVLFRFGIHVLANSKQKKEGILTEKIFKSCLIARLNVALVVALCARVCECV